MASANIAQRTITRPARKPDPSRVVQSYYHIRDTDGERGAARKTGEIYGISHMTVRRYVAAFEAAQNVPDEPEDLIYCPPPGGYPEPIVPIVTEPIIIETSQTPSIACDELMSIEHITNEAGPQETKNVCEETSHEETSQIHSTELEPPIAITVETTQPVIVRERVVQRVVVHERVEVGLVGWIREHPGAAHQAVAWLIAAVLIGVASLG